MAQTNGTSTSTIKVAVTQAEPVWLDLQGTVDKTCKLIEEAAGQGAKLIAFPECWIPGYPCWIWLRAVDPTTMATYIKNSLRIDSPQMQRICSAAAEHNIAVVLGFAEAQNASLYISQATISSTGELLMTRRKLKPTHLERTVFGDAGASCLHNVTPLNLASGSGGDAVNVGALSCWEHIQPLLKYHTYLQNEQLHVAAWPPLDPHPGPETPALWSMSREGCLSLSQTYAVESAAYVLHCTTVITQAGIEGMQTQQCMMFNVPGGGGSCVIGPDGRRMTGELKGEEEGIVYAELDMDTILKTKCFVDSTGHYSRPDMLWLGVDDREKKHRVVSKAKDEDA